MIGQRLHQFVDGGKVRIVGMQVAIGRQRLDTVAAVAMALQDQRELVARAARRQQQRESDGGGRQRIRRGIEIRGNVVGEGFVHHRRRGRIGATGRSHIFWSRRRTAAIQQNQCRNGAHHVLHAHGHPPEDPRMAADHLPHAVQASVHPNAGNTGPLATQLYNCLHRSRLPISSGPPAPILSGNNPSLPAGSGSRRTGAPARGTQPAWAPPG